MRKKSFDKQAFNSCAVFALAREVLVEMSESDELVGSSVSASSKKVKACKKAALCFGTDAAAQGQRVRGAAQDGSNGLAGGRQVACPFFFLFPPSEKRRWNSGKRPEKARATTAAAAKKDASKEGKHGVGTKKKDDKTVAKKSVKGKKQKRDEDDEEEEPEEEEAEKKQPKAAKVRMARDDCVFCNTGKQVAKKKPAKKLDEDEEEEDEEEEEKKPAAKVSNWRFSHLRLTSCTEQGNKEATRRGGG